MKAELTFILPTRNRRTVVKRAIDSCLACETNVVKSYVIVIDGGSTDGTLAFLKETYSNDARVKLLENKTADFMHTCFQGVGLVETEFATFMYDDDVLSPYFKDMISYMLDNHKSFIMGYGSLYEVEEIYPFKPIKSYKEYDKLDLLLGYFDRSEHLDFSLLPVSPICCLVTTQFLRAWVTRVIAFAKKNKLREHFILRRNIGPDLLIYLSAILQESGKVAVASAIVAQFSLHASSMSVTYGNLDLCIGYWLTKIWAFQRLCEAGHPREAAACGAYLLAYGAILVGRKIIRRESSWVKSICREMLDICQKIHNESLVLSTLKAFLPIISNRYRLSNQDLPV